MQKHTAKYTRLHARRFCIWTAVTAVGHISLSGARKVQEKPSGPAENHAFGPAAFSCSYLSGCNIFAYFSKFFWKLPASCFANCSYSSLVLPACFQACSGRSISNKRSAIDGCSAILVRVQTSCGIFSPRIRISSHTLSGSVPSWMASMICIVRPTLHRSPTPHGPPTQPVFTKYAFAFAVCSLATNVST